MIVNRYIFCYFRLCLRTSYIPKIVKTLLQDSNKGEIESSLERQCTMLRNMKSNMVRYLKELPNEKGELIREIKQFKLNVIFIAEKLERSSMLEVEKIYQTITDDIDRDMQVMDQMIYETEIYLDKIEKNKFEDDKDEFVTLKLSERHLKKAEGILIKFRETNVRTVDFSPHYSMFLDQHSLGYLNGKFRNRNY